MSSVFRGFREFILRGNALELAIAVLIGSAFSALVNALVKDLLTPCIGAMIHIEDFSKLTYRLNGSIFFYGDFINAAIAFLIDAIALYFLVIMPMNALILRVHSKKEPTPHTKVCPECLTTIPLEARRCSACTQLQVASPHTQSGSFT